MNIKTNIITLLVAGFALFATVGNAQNYHGKNGYQSNRAHSGHVYKGHNTYNKNYGKSYNYGKTYNHGYNKSYNKSYAYRPKHVSSSTYLKKAVIARVLGY